MHTFSETGTGVPAFLAKLWRLVEDPETNDLIYWNRDGRSFIIQNQAQFARELLPMNYKHNNMASFIRQLNMYGFHKITSIENGGLKFDRDEMEFSHPCFKRGYPYLLEHIKRKIATAKTTIDEKANIKPEAVSKVLNDVKVMRGRQDSLDSRFSAMKQENEALWREIAALRQKHMKQQQIVNKLIQFLVTIVQPSRNMSGVKRHFQLMINDVPQSSKVRKHSEDNTGPVIHELTEELLDEVAESDAEMMINNSPVMSPGDASSRTGADNGEDYSRPRSNLSISSLHESNHDEEFLLSPHGRSSSVTVDTDGPSFVYHITELPEDVETEQVKKYTPKSTNRSTTHRGRKRKHVECEVEDQKNPQQPTRPSQQNTNRISNATDTNVLNIKTEKDIDPLSFLDGTLDSNQASIDPSLMSPMGNNTSDETQLPTTSGGGTNNDKQMYISKEDFISNEMPTDLFEDSMLGDINLASGSYNQNLNFSRSKSRPSGSGTSTAVGGSNTTDQIEQRQNLALAKYNNEDIMRQDITSHLDNTQDDLDSLKDLLRGEGYSFDANSLLGNASPANRLILPTSLDGDILAKLFSDSDILAPYGLSLSADQQNQDNSKKGSELMTYQPYYSGDLSDMLNMDSDSLMKNTEYDEKQNAENDSTLNTPLPERENRL